MPSVFVRQVFIESFTPLSRYMLTQQREEGNSKNYNSSDCFRVGYNQMCLTAGCQKPTFKIQVVVG
jgi:hypothetical protein